MFWYIINLLINGVCDIVTYILSPSKSSGHCGCGWITQLRLMRPMDIESGGTNTERQNKKAAHDDEWVGGLASGPSPLAGTDRIIIICRPGQLDHPSINQRCNGGDEAHVE